MTAMVGSSGQHRLHRGEYEIAALGMDKAPACHVPIGYQAATASASCGCSTCLTNSSSMLIVIVSPTSQPPVSSATFQFRSQCLRLILVCALKPALSVPQGVLACPAYSTSSTTGFVTSRIVRSP